MLSVMVCSKQPANTVFVTGFWLDFLIYVMISTRIILKIYYYGYVDEKGRKQKGYEERIAELVQKYPLGQPIIGEQPS